MRNASALRHYLAIVRKRIGRELQPAARFMRHGQTRQDAPSGARRRYQLRWGGRYRYDPKAKVWRLQPPDPNVSLLQRLREIVRFAQPAQRTPRGRLSNPTALR